MHRKIVFIKVEVTVIEISESVIDLDAVTLLVLLASEIIFFRDPKEHSTN